MNMMRRDFLKTGMAAVGAASIGAVAEGIIGKSAAAGETAAPDYKLYALKYAGPFTSSVAMVIFLKDWDKKIKRNYYIWAVQGGGNTVVFDCGVRPDFAAERAWLRASYVSPDKVLKRIGINAAEVEHLVISHIHFDHNGGLELFPKAKVYVQRKEFDFWVYDPVAKRPPCAHVSDAAAIRQLGDLKGSERLVLVDGDREILPGIELLLTPGHTIALQSMAVKTAKGLAILTSDCAHVHKSYEIDTPSCLITDMPGWLRSYTKLREKVNGNIKMLFPGHDKKMLDDYPVVAEDVTQLV
ncbi:MAG: N-acyl homoserine lactonase family protein [Deltaproteobacteria bacterium]|nr:N-acyl homoserine lactonase family protein [Deltaproteobacteria bacterium]MBW2309126.1 N-acyl homoserine lactonase family protein [Deltaproteobacteria bacterium]